MNDVITIHFSLHIGEIPEWPNGTDCKSVIVMISKVRILLSPLELVIKVKVYKVIKYFTNFLLYELKSGSSSFGRASAFQAEGGGFEPRLPLKRRAKKEKEYEIRFHALFLRSRSVFFGRLSSVGRARPW